MNKLPPNSRSMICFGFHHTIYPLENIIQYNSAYWMFHPMLFAQFIGEREFEMYK